MQAMVQHMWLHTLPFVTAAPGSVRRTGTAQVCMGDELLLVKKFDRLMPERSDFASDLIFPLLSLTLLFEGEFAARFVQCMNGMEIINGMELFEEILL